MIISCDHPYLVYTLYSAVAIQAAKSTQTRLFDFTLFIITSMSINFEVNELRECISNQPTVHPHTHIYIIS